MYLFQMTVYICIVFVTNSMANLQELIVERDQLLSMVDRNKEFLSGNTNKLFYQTQVKGSFTYFIPAYLRLIFNSIEGIDFKNLKADVHGDLYFTLNVKDLPDSVAEHVKQNIRFLFSNDPEIAVTEGMQEDGNQIYFEEEKEKTKGVLVNHYYHFHVRQKFKATMVPYIFLTPFQTIDLILFVATKIDPMRYELIKEEKEVQNFPKEFCDRVRDGHPPKQLKFLVNLMDHNSNKYDEDGNLADIGQDEERVTIDYGIIKDFGNYSVADKQLVVEYSNESVSQEIINVSKDINDSGRADEEQEEKNLNRMKNFQFAHFHIKVYRNPSSATCTIFVPVLLLTIINIGIFFQINGLSGRIQNIAGLMFAYTALIMVIRSQIPVYRYVTLMEILVYFLTGTTLLCLLEGIIFQRLGNFKISINNPLLLTTIIVSALATIIVIVLMIWHRCYRLHKFTEVNELSIDQREGASAGGKYDPNGWGNQQCDKHFMKFFDSGKIRASRSLNKMDAEMKGSKHKEN